jgi:hypothetical protein
LRAVLIRGCYPLLPVFRRRGASAYALTRTPLDQSPPPPIFAKGQSKPLVERIERLDEEKKVMFEDVRNIVAARDCESKRRSPASKSRIDLSKPHLCGAGASFGRSGFGQNGDRRICEVL